MGDSNSATEVLAAATISDDVTLAKIVQTAAGQFVRQARVGNDPTRFRLDLYRKVEVQDRAISILGRKHAVAVRISITCESLLFDRGEKTATVVLPPQFEPWVAIRN
jgi:hypothetical protein